MCVLWNEFSPLTITKKIKKTFYSIDIILGDVFYVLACLIEAAAGESESNPGSMTV